VIETFAEKSFNELSEEQELKLLFWKKDLSQEEQTVIESIMKDSLEKLNYK